MLLICVRKFECWINWLFLLIPCIRVCGFCRDRCINILVYSLVCEPRVFSFNVLSIVMKIVIIR